MTVAPNNLWALIPGGREVDPVVLLGAIERQVACGDLDFRTRLLIRDGLNAVERRWGAARLDRWLEQCGGGRQIREIRDEPLGKPGFPSLAWRVMEPTRSESIFEFL